MSVAKPEVVGQRHLRGAVAQHRANLVRLGLDDLDSRSGCLAPSSEIRRGRMNGVRVTKHAMRIRAAHLAGLTAGRVQNLAEVLEQRPRVPQHLLTCRGEDEPAGPLPDEELGADLMLELGDRRRDRGLRDPQFVGGLGHAAVGRGLHEVPQLGQRDIGPTSALTPLLRPVSYLSVTERPWWAPSSNPDGDRSVASRCSTRRGLAAQVADGAEQRRARPACPRVNSSNSPGGDPPDLLEVVVQPEEPVQRAGEHRDPAAQRHPREAKGAEDVGSRCRRREP